MLNPSCMQCYHAQTMRTACTLIHGCIFAPPSEYIEHFLETRSNVVDPGLIARMLHEQRQLSLLNSTGTRGDGESNIWHVSMHARMHAVMDRSQTPKTTRQTQACTYTCVKRCACWSLGEVARSTTSVQHTRPGASTNICLQDLCSLKVRGIGFPTHPFSLILVNAPASNMVSKLPYPI